MSSNRLDILNDIRADLCDNDDLTNDPYGFAMSVAYRALRWGFANEGFMNNDELHTIARVIDLIETLDPPIVNPNA